MNQQAVRSAPQGLISWNGAVPQGFFERRLASAESLREVANAYPVAPSEAQDVEVFNTVRGDVVWSCRDGYPSEDNRPVVFASLNGIMLSRDELARYRGADEVEQALACFYDTHIMRGVAITDYSHGMKKNYQSPQSETIIALGGMLDMHNYGKEYIRAGTILIACLGAPNGKPSKGISPRKYAAHLRPLNPDIVFVSARALRKHFGVRNADEMKITRGLKYTPGNQVVLSHQKTHAPLEALAKAGTQLQDWAGDEVTSLEIMVKTIMMHTIDVMRATGMMPVGGVPSEEIAGMVAASSAANEAQLKMSRAACETLKRRDWTEGTIVSKALLSMVTGYEVDKTRHTNPFVRSAEMNAYKWFNASKLDAIRMVMERHVGTAESDAAPGEFVAVNVKVN